MGTSSVGRAGLKSLDSEVNDRQFPISDLFFFFPTSISPSRYRSPLSTIALILLSPARETHRLSNSHLPRNESWADSFAFFFFFSLLALGCRYPRDSSTTWSWGDRTSTRGRPTRFVCFLFRWLIERRELIPPLSLSPLFPYSPLSFTFPPSALFTRPSILFLLRNRFPATSISIIPSIPLPLSPSSPSYLLPTDVVWLPSILGHSSPLLRRFPSSSPVSFVFRRFFSSPRPAPHPTCIGHSTPTRTTPRESCTSHEH